MTATVALEIEVLFILLCTSLRYFTTYWDYRIPFQPLFGTWSRIVQNLELIEPLASTPGLVSNRKNSLFRMLNTTKTIGGSRLLRANLLQPLKDIETINARLDCLDELTSNEKLFFGLSQVLQKFPKDTDRVLCHFCFKPKKTSIEGSKFTSARRSQMVVASIILLKAALEALPLLSEVLKHAKSFLLSKIYRSICENKKYSFIQKK
eukprot:Gb_27667 [translate_table: standard]